MPAFNFTADSSTDTITITGHGLLTGDGPVCVRNVGGALPGGLVAQTDYWVIRLDANTLRLATSSGAANNSTYINLTSNGSGTNILEVGIPYRRPRTYVQSVSQIDARDLNASHDAWAALHALLTAQPQSVWGGVNLLGDLSVAGQVTSDLSLAAGKKIKHGVRTMHIPVVPHQTLGPVTGRSAKIKDLGSGATLLFVDLPLEVGVTIAAIRARVKDTTEPATAYLRLFSATGATYSTLLATSTTSAGSGAEQTISASGLSIVTQPLTRYAAIVACVAGTTDVEVFFLEVDYLQA